MKRRPMVILLTTVLVAICMAQAAYAAAANTVGLNGKIYTVNNKQPWAQAVAVKGTDIVYVGIWGRCVDRFVIRWNIGTFL